MALEIPAWYGEFGWEVMSWIPYWRKLAKGHDIVTASSFKGMHPLYKDFVTNFIPHNETSRSLNYQKKYRVDGTYYKYGIPDESFDIIIHARGIRRKSSINYKRWEEVVDLLKDYKIAFVGSELDYCLEGRIDLRNIDLQLLMNYMAGAKIIIGVSSGIMHLASACGCSQVVWGDDRTYFGETLEKRYKKTWNPFNTKVEYIYNWQPEPEEILKRIEMMNEEVINENTA